MAEVIVYPISNDDKKETVIGDYLKLFYNPVNLVIPGNISISSQINDEDYLDRVGIEG